MPTNRRQYSPSCSPCSNLSRRQIGLSVVETIIVVGITTVLITVLTRFLVVGYPLSKTAYLQTRATETARVQLKRLVKMLREAHQSDTGAYPLMAIGPQKIVFYSDVDADNATERVRLELINNQLVKGILKPSGDPLEYDLANETQQVIIGDIRNGSDPIFTYYSGDYPFVSTPLSATEIGAVKYIEFNLIIDADPAINPPAIEIKSQVQLRNLKTNLGQTVTE